jgi:TPR repeat protein
MRSHTILLTAALVMSWGCQTTPPLTYDQLSDKVANGEQVQAGDLRTAFLRDPKLPTKMERLLDLEQQALSIVEDEPLKLGSRGQAILDTYQASITGHYVMTRFYEHVEMPEAAAVHQNWLERIRTDMTKAGDGSRERPLPAMTSVEAQMYAISTGLSPVGAIYQTSDEHPFSLLTQVKPADGPVESLTFDLGALYQAMRLDFAVSAPDDADHGEEFSPFSVIGYLAKRGDTSAQAAIGAFLASQGRRSDAADWLRASARAGNLVASSLLARLYWEEASTAKDPAVKEEALKEVLDNYLHAIALGSTDAMYALAVLYLNNHYGEENRPSGVTLLAQAAEARHSDAAVFLAHLNYTGDLVERDLAQARSYYIQASELDNAFARRSYARFLLDRSADQEPDPRVIDWLEELAREEDDPEAMLLLGNLYARGVGAPQNFRRAVSRYKDAVKVSPEDASIVNEVAWTLTVSNFPDLQRTRYARSIMDTMMEANEAARERPEYLDTWAAAHAATGDFDRAIELQEQALAVAEEMEFDSVMDILREHLDAFRAGQTIIETAP